MKNPYEAIIKLLQDSNVAYEQVEHEPVYTSEQAAAIRGQNIEQGAKSLLFKTKKDFVLVVLPGNKRVDSKKLKKLLSVSEARFASPAEVKQVMGCEIGACYPFGNVADLPTYVDSSLAEQESISCNPGRHDISLTLKFKDYADIVKPQIVEVAE